MLTAHIPAMVRLSTDLCKKLWIFIAPLLLCPLVIFGGKELRCVFCILLLSGFWIVEVVPMAVTSLLPIFLLPFLDIMDAKKVCEQYMKDTTVILMITLFMAIAVEETNLHKRIALKMLSKVGTKQSTLLGGFMLVTAFISFFVSDSATTALMIPIAVAVLGAMFEHSVSETNGNDLEKTSTEKKQQPSSIADTLCVHMLSKKDRGFCKALILVCAHASLIGGTAILTSTGPNLIFRDEINKRFPEGEVTMTYLQWMSFAIPPMFGYLLASYVVVQLVFMGPASLLDLFRKQTPDAKKKADAVERSVKTAYKALGPISFAEKSVMFWFVVLIAAWIFREPGFMKGWADLMPQAKGRFTDSCIGIFVVFVLFAWPKHGFRLDAVHTDAYSPESRNSAPETILSWPVVQRRMSWSVILLIGAGFTVSEAVKVSGLSKTVSCVVSSFGDSPPILIQAAITATITFMTEFASNTATASIFVPIVQNIAESLHIHPLYFGIPSAIAPSFAFMLPMATPPNAIVYDTRVVGFVEMFLSGVLLNCVCICVTVLSMNTWTFWLFNLGHLPESLAMSNTTIAC